MTRPSNLILFQSDNHNRDLLGCYGHPIVKTPNLDRIAERGAMFNNAYCSSSLCCPSRASLATGLYPHQTGYWDNCLVFDGSRPNWARHIREQGHTAVSVGKLHFRSTEDDNGFSQEIAPMHIINGVGGLIMLLRWSEAEPVQSGQWRMYSTESKVGTSNYQDYDREITRLAIEWLQNEANKLDKPWVLYVSYVSAHPPFSVPQRLWDMYPEEEMPLPRAYAPGERPEHPAYQHLRSMKGIGDLGAEHEAMLRRVAAVRPRQQQASTTCKFRRNISGFDTNNRAWLRQPVLSSTTSVPGGGVRVSAPMDAITSLPPSSFTRSRWSAFARASTDSGSQTARSSASRSSANAFAD